LMVGAMKRLTDCLEAVGFVDSIDGLRNVTVRFAKGLGFDYVSATVVIDRAEGADFYCVDNTPEAYRPIFENQVRSRGDPVMQHCKLSSRPIVWHQSTYVSAGRADLWEEQARHGYRSGIALALHLPAGRHFLVGIDRGQASLDDAEQCSQQAAELLLFASCAEGVGTRLLVPVADSGAIAELSSREREALQWTMGGKTAWEIGRILGISEQTVVRHLAHAARKLGCVNKVQAVAKALRLGMIR
jgi:DNA-binding CsgD family transcriptional regulator